MTTTRDKAALIIGAGDGTGGAVATRFAREGFVACSVQRTADKLEPLVRAIESTGGRAPLRTRRAQGRTDGRARRQVAADRRVRPSSAANHAVVS
jgi:NADP-dependent 3-hydroxy acid dehydrogenase YdfG